MLPACEQENLKKSWNAANPLSWHAVQAEKVSVVLCEVPDCKQIDTHLLRIDPACGWKRPQGWVARTGGAGLILDSIGCLT